MNSVAQNSTVRTSVTLRSCWYPFDDGMADIRSRATVQAYQYLESQQAAASVWILIRRRNVKGLETSDLQIQKVLTRTLAVTRMPADFMEHVYWPTLINHYRAEAAA